MHTDKRSIILLIHYLFVDRIKKYVFFLNKHWSTVGRNSYLNSFCDCTNQNVTKGLEDVIFIYFSDC